MYTSTNPLKISDLVVGEIRWYKIGGRKIILKNNKIKDTDKQATSRTKKK